MQVIVPVAPMIRLKMSLRASHQPMICQIDVKGAFRLISEEDLNHCNDFVGMKGNRNAKVS